jgi:uncharacterized protein (DUF1697 family)
VTTRVAFFRAVNLGKRRTPNARLIEITARLGHEGAWTHVTSGNLVFEASGGRASLEQAFEHALEAEFGFAVETFVRSAAELRKALALEPFEVGTGDTYFVTFLKDAPTRSQEKELEDLSGSFDTLVVAGRDVHWLMHGKSTDTKIPTRAWEKVIGHHTSTSRNTTMLRKLVDKIDSA